ncbi:MAG TPA: putative zinc-binding metallopeptidase [Thermoanaerobaculia bacterium]|nr:putative zinc-binding metallopeptidase [Burkholderiales bacterium]HYC60462.1 putative zinc-binding metallopeptidase [Thermoanaerobaculia bacterium]
MTTRKRANDWEALPDAELLDVRICNLNVRIEDTWIEESLADLHEDLERREIPFRPHAWLSTDWFVPDHVPGIAIPFYLAHPRLMALERKQMLDVEGGTRQEMIKILRHECGHALDNAYGLGSDPVRRQVFGDHAKRYPEHYRPNPASRRFVQHLRLYYAQSHPAEDFAETFAVVIGSRGDGWRKRYADWPALQKLEYVDSMLEKLRGKMPRRRSRNKPESVPTLRMTLREYYADKRERYLVSYPDIYDRDLRRLFSDDPKHQRHELASRFLRRNSAEIRRLVSNWTGEYQFTLEQVLKDMIGRSRELKLRAAGPERRLKMEFAILLTVKTMDFHYSRRNWFAL